MHLARGNKNYPGDLMENSLIKYLGFLFFVSYLKFALQYTGKQNAHNVEMAITKVLNRTQLNPGISYIKLERVQINL
ncbi:hypothetical protein L345_06885, partial [Ophiophagus hannah]